MLSATCDFLGLVHNLEQALTEGRIAFVPRERVGQSYTSLLDTCLEQEWCDPQQANKLRGIKAFTSLGQYGSVGRIGLAPLAQRQYSDQPPWQLSGRLRRGLQFLKMLDTMMPPRDVFLWKPWIPPLVVASDGRVDDTAIPSAGVCLYDPLTDAKYAWCMELCSELCLRWRDRHCIMEVEAMPVVTVVLEMCELFRGRDVIWYIDNVAALSAFVKGGSEAEDLDRAAAVLSLAAARLQARFWFEYIQSESNWADELSRSLENSAWTVANGFALRRVQVPAWPWAVRQQDLVCTLEMALGAALGEERGGAAVEVVELR